MRIILISFLSAPAHLIFLVLCLGHTSYINAVAWDPEGRYLASVSDDNSCIIWTNNDEQCSEHSLFPLKSAGMSVKWHPDDSEKILVAEKKGVIHMYNVVSVP